MTVFQKRLLAMTAVFAVIFVTRISAQDQHAIVITADQPNVWTLEQAHYLLAQMHRRNLDLKAANLGDLDPNAIDGVNIDVLKTLLEASAEFDQAKGFNSSIVKDQKEFNANRRMDLLRRRAQLQDDQLELANQKAKLQVLLARTTDETERKNLETAIAEIEVTQGAVKAQVTQIDEELKITPGSTGDFQMVSPQTSFDRFKLAGANDSAFQTAIQKAIESFSAAPKLNASLRLENYLQMQYEILSKQLTLLRDEVGPGERLIFLEMPQSIRSTYDKSDKKWAQSWWKIRAYTKCASVQEQPRGSKVDDDPYILLGQRLNSLQNAALMVKVAIKKNGKTSASLQAAIDGLKAAEAKVNDAAKLVAQSGRVLNATANPTYAVQRDTIRSQVFDAVKDALTDATAAFAAVRNEATTALRDARLAEVVVPPPARPAKASAAGEVPGAREQIIRDEIQRSFNALISMADKFQEATLNRTYLSWLSIADKYKEPEDKLSPAYNPFLTGLKANIKADLITLGLTAAQADLISPGLANKLVQPSRAPASRSDPCTRGGDETTSNMVNALIKGENLNGRPANELITVVDLDEDRIADPTENSPYRNLFERIRSEYASVSGNAATEPIYPMVENREARIVDLFPRQGSLNVNDVKQRTYNMSLRFVFSLLSGFGGNADYKRSRERYSQFVQQELYSAGFGKGSREFGWTFYPMPGATRLSSGTRTTYSIMVVPKSANTLLLQSTGCYYHRAERQFETFKEALQFDNEDGRHKGRCSTARSFIVPIPTALTGDQVFWVSSIDYKPVQAGRRVTVSIRGRDFSSQMGILVDGIPLKPSLGLGQPFIIDDSLTRTKVEPDASIRGSFERVDSTQIIASFEMGSDYKRGTPQITLIAPGRGLLLNDIDEIYVNGYGGGLEASRFMFGDGDPNDPSPVITVGNLSKKDANSTAVVLKGRNFDRVTSVFANGEVCAGEGISGADPVGTFRVEGNGTFLKCNFKSDEQNVILTLLYPNGSIQSSALSNPHYKKSETPGPASLDTYAEDAGFVVTLVELIGRKPKAGTADFLVSYRVVGKGISADTKTRTGNFEFVRKVDANLSEGLFTVEQSMTPLTMILLKEPAGTGTKGLKSMFIIPSPPDPRLDDDKDD